MPRCKAKAKSSGKQCQRDAVKGKEVCVVHGGGAPKSRGTSSGRPATTLERTKHLPSKNLRDAFERILGDPELLSLEHDIATQELFINEALLRTGNGDTLGFREAARGKMGDALMKLAAMPAVSSMLPEKEGAKFTAWQQDFLKKMQALQTLLSDGLDEAVAREEVGRLMERKQRLKDSEQKRLKDMQEMMSNDQVLHVITKVAGLINEVFGGDKRINAFLARLDNEVLGLAAPEAIRTDGG